MGNYNRPLKRTFFNFLPQSIVSRIFLAAIWMLFFCFFLISDASAAVYCMKTTGVKTVGSSVIDNWTDGNCYDNLGSIFSQMQGGDDIVIDDGEYTGAGNHIWQFSAPPSGAANNYTEIRARNIPGQGGISSAEALRVRFTDWDSFYVVGSGAGFREYIKFEGIRWNGVTTYDGWNRLIFKQCAVQGVGEGNYSAFTIGGAYNLLEDVVVFGMGRYKLLFYEYGTASDNLCRRCIVRQDWANANASAEVDMPIAAISNYYTRRNAFLNTIIIDGDNPAYWDDRSIELAGSFYQPNDAGPNAMTIKGSIVLNTATAAVQVTANSSGHIIEDLVVAKTAGGIHVRGGANINRVTVVDIGLNNFTYRDAAQASRVIGPDYGVFNDTANTVTLSNSIFRSILDTAVKGNISQSSLNIFASGNPGVVPSFSYDPFLKGLSYPLRVEEGSVLQTAGAGGGQIGARIVNKLGVDGTFKGDPDWDTEQAQSLWPWPLEDWVRAEMRTMDQVIDGNVMPAANRGFAADGQTLTKYIWESFGNIMPTEIYNHPTIGVTDFLQLIINWLTSNSASDKNSDGSVNTRDLGIMMSGWE